jgi:CHAT domain-containing protein/tetratricopeptide (TPR) repeat protein
VLRSEEHYPPLIALADPPPPRREAELAEELVRAVVHDSGRAVVSQAIPVRRRWLPLILARDVLSDSDAPDLAVTELPAAAREPYLLFLQRVRQFRSASRARAGLSVLLSARSTEDAQRVVGEFPELSTDVGVQAAEDWLATGVPPGESPEPLEAILAFVAQLERGAQLREAWDALSTRLSHAGAGLTREFEDILVEIRSLPPTEPDEAHLTLLRRATSIATGAGLSEAPLLLYQLGTALLKAAGPYGSTMTAEAITVLEEARQRLPTQDPLLGPVLAHLGMAWFRSPVGDRADNLENARACMQQALTILEGRAHRWDHAVVVRNLALVYLDREEGEPAANLAEALRLAKVSLTEAEASGKGEDLAHAYTTLGMVQFRRAGQGHPGAIGEARDAFEKALGDFDRTTSPLEWAHLQHNLGCTLLDSSHPTPEDLDGAVEHLRLALEVRGDSAAIGARAERSVSLTALARALEAKGELPEAIRIYEDALKAITPYIWPAQCRETAARLAGARAAMGDWPGSILAYEVAIEAAETLYRSRGRAERRRGEIAESPRLWQHAGYALARAGHPERAVEVLELGRARELGATVARDEADLQRLSEIDQAIAEQFVDARSELRKAERAMQVALREQGGERLRAATTHLDDVVGAIRGIPGFERYLAGPSLDEIFEAADDWPIAYIVVAPAGTCTLLVDGTGERRDLERHHTGTFTDKELSTVLIGDPTSRVPTGLLPAQAGRPGKLDRALHAALELVGREVAWPLATMLGDRAAAGVTLIPCGALGLVPLHAAFWRESAEDRCLADDFVTTYAPSAAVLSAARTRARRLSSRRTRVIAVGNPQPAADPLPGAEVEVGWICHIYGEQADTRIREAATLEFLRTRLSDATHLHLACHGHGDLIDPDRSNLVLADGSVTLRSLREWGQLNCRLVVLSACESGRFELLRTPDEVLGLPAGFLRAGSACVVASLWPVDDWPTALLMSRFYELLAHDHDTGEPADPAIALWKAMHWLRGLDRRTKKRYLEERPELLRQLKEALGRAGRISSWFSGAVGGRARGPGDRPRIWAAFYVSGA